MSSQRRKYPGQQSGGSPATPIPTVSPVLPATNVSSSPYPQQPQQTYQPQPQQTYQPQPQPQQTYQPQTYQPQPQPQQTYQPYQPQQTYQPQTTASPPPQSPFQQRFQSLSQAQCPKELLRMTINCAPQTPVLLQKLAIPFGCVMHPLSPQSNLHLVDFGNIGVIRCRRCRSYINPFVTWHEGGRKWKCNLCGLFNDVPSDYYSALDDMGIRKDIEERLELCCGAIEFVAPEEYMVRPPQPSVYFFVMDVSIYAVSSGQLQTATDTILRTLDGIPGDSRTKIGFITFDSKCHFYNLRSKGTKPQLMVVNPLDKIVVPAGYDFLVNLRDAKTVITSLLTDLPKMFSNTQDVKSCLGPALKAAFHIQRPIGGKMLVFTSLLPSVGTGKLESRLDPKILGTEKEVILMKPQNEFYKKFALNCSNEHIAVDIFVFSRENQYCDVATLGTLSEVSGGQLFYYPNFNAQTLDSHKFAMDLYTDLTRETGFEAVMRVRCSQGATVQNHFGNFFIRSTDLLALPNVDPSKAFGIQLNVVEDLSSVMTTIGPYLSLQAALLYTTSTSERRIRVLNAAVPITSDLTYIYGSADVEAIVNLTTKMAIQKSLTTKIADAREALINKLIDILVTYKQNFGASTLPTQVALPETLKLLPLYILACAKSSLFRSVPPVYPDIRSYHMHLFRILSVELSSMFLYPRFYALHNISEQVGLPDSEGFIVLPQPMNLSSEKLDRNGIFLLDNGQQLLMRIAKLADPELLTQIFGTSDLSQIPLNQTIIQPNPDEPAESTVNRIANIIQALQQDRLFFPRLHIFREGEGLDIQFLSSLIEDRTNNVQSYQEFLIQIQRTVTNKLK